MAVPSRFECASSLLGVSSLISKTRRALWVCIALGMATHLSLLGIRGVETERKAAKPLTTQFVKCQPRLSKPLELKKWPQPKRRHLRRRMVAVRAKSHGEAGTSKIQAFALAGRLARPSVRVFRPVGLVGAEMEPQSMAQMIEGEKEARHAVDMSLEMLDPEAMDTGRYHAVVIQDPTDKRNIKGFFRLKYAYSQNETRPLSVQRGDWRTVHALVSMIDAMNQYTNIKASYEGKIPYTSAELLRTPWAFCVIDSPFEFSEAEASALGK